MQLSNGKSKIHCSEAGASCCVPATRLWAALGVEQRGAECPTQRSGPLTVPRTQHDCWSRRVTTVHRTTVVCVPCCDPPRCHRPSQTTPWVLVTAGTCSTPGVHLHIEGPGILFWAGQVPSVLPLHEPRTPQGGHPCLGWCPSVLSAPLRQNPSSTPLWSQELDCPNMWALGKKTENRTRRIKLPGAL